MNEVTRILEAIDQGDPHAAEQLLPLVYDELRKLAAQRLAHEKPGQTLQATALVHEAYLRLVGGEPCASGTIAATSSTPRPRRCGGSWLSKPAGNDASGMAAEKTSIDLDEACSVVQPPADDLLELDEALNRLAALKPVRAQVVKLRFFAGLTMPEVARALGLSLPTAERYWAFARTWLYAELHGQDTPSGV